MQEFVCTCATKLVARRHLAIFRFSASGGSTDSSSGVSERSRSVAVAQYDSFCELTHSAYALPEPGSPEARSQHLVGHFKNASNRSEVTFMQEFTPSF